MVYRLLLETTSVFLRTLIKLCSFCVLKHGSLHWKQMVSGSVILYFSVKFVEIIAHTK